VWRNNDWVIADNDVSLNDGVVVRKNGEVKKGDDVVVLKDGEVVDRSGRFLDNYGK
jgi:SOS-response transcriptional repressor LexA